MPIHQTARTFGARRVPTTTAASGCWQLGEVTQARRDGIWPNATDPLFSDVVLLLQESLTDQSLQAQTVTATGTAGASTGQVRFGSSAFFSDGSSNRISVANDASLAMAGDFTIETWVYFVTYAANEIFYIWRPANHSSGNRMQFLVLNDKLYADMFGTVLAQSTALSFAAGQWYHVAASRQSGTLRFFLDGTTVATAAKADSLSADEYYLPHSGTATRELYFDDFRVTVGSSRYNGNFTPPTTPFLSE